ncbi:MAG: hypothetical protein DRP08_03490 [Candidatus Aenigmatarchaeota archaeon]|nr:MAG: hypothetical protein DRP08_03490 [Candidatus Aenigmarchaeota archaeon]
MTKEEAAIKLVELDEKKAEIKKWYEDLAEVLETLGPEAHFQSPDGQVFLIEEANGKWVNFDKLRYIRTKKADEKRGELSKKRAQELGYEVE